MACRVINLPDALIFKVIFLRGKIIPNMPLRRIVRLAGIIHAALQPEDAARRILIFA